MAAAQERARARTSFRERRDSEQETGDRHIQPGQRPGRRTAGRGGSTDRDGEQPPGHLHHGGTAEVAGEERDVDGGRHEDDLEVRPLGQQAPEDAQEEVVVEVPFVDFVHYQDLVLGQAGLPLDLPQEQSHRQEHDLGGRRPRALKADLVANLGGRGVVRRGACT